MNYKAKFTGLGHLDIHTLRTMRCVLPISLGNTNQVSEKLQATLSCVSKHFGQCCILVADILHRHNQENTNKHALHEKGKSWLIENQPYFRELSIPHTITFWEECLQNPGYVKAKQKIDKLYRNSEQYRLLVQEDAALYQERQINSSKLTTENASAAINKSIDYFLEETAVTISYFLENNFNVMIYPGDIPSSIKYVTDKYVKPKHPNLLINSKVYFRKKTINLSLNLDSRSSDQKEESSGH